MNNKHQQWWDSLSPQMKDYLERQPIWHDRDMYKAAAVGAVVGLFIGIVVGFEWAWRPVVTVIRPLSG